MLHKVGSDLDISVTATSSFSPRRAEKLKDKRSSQLEKLNQAKQNASRSEISTTEQKLANDETRQLKLPVLSTRRVNNEENNDLQVRLRGIQCSDISLKQYRTEWIDKSTKKSRMKSPSSCSQRLEPTSSTLEFTQDRVLFVQEQNHLNNSGGELESAGDILKDRSQRILPISRSILEGQRVNLREKMGLNKHRQHVRRTPRKANKLCNQSESTAETFDTENILMKTRKTSSSTVSSKTKKQGARRVFHLPKADKYDITPRNILNTQVCSVFKVDDLKSSLFHSEPGYTWIPSRDSYVIKNSVFKAIAQPTVFLRQPSPVAGVKMTLKEHEDSLAAAIQAVEETNVTSPTVDAEVNRQVKKFVIKLPPIC